jgi:hypothetical protein
MSGHAGREVDYDCRVIAIEASRRGFIEIEQDCAILFSVFANLAEKDSSTSQIPISEWAALVQLAVLDFSTAQGLASDAR